MQPCVETCVETRREIVFVLKNKEKRIHPDLDNEALCRLGKQVIDIEIESIYKLLPRIDQTYAQACRLLLNCKGRVIVLGIGKSGHIARKIAATLSSTGTASFFIHPAEANHGDLGMVADQDVVIAISNSGETQEILSLLPIIKSLDLPMIAMTGKSNSTIAQFATVHLDVSVEKEACPLGLAPTSSTTVALVMGDALAITLLEARGFQPNDFARYHPGGALGRRLLLRVDELMNTHNQLPRVQNNCLLSDALIEITQKSLGMTTVVDADNNLLGIFTDGDLRRTLDQNLDIHTTPIANMMTKNCITISPAMLAIEALQIMKEYKITSLVVVEKNKPVGVVHMHALLRAGII